MSDMNKKVIIIGAGGHGRVIADIVKLNGDEIIGYLDDNKTGEFNGYSIIGTSDDICLNDLYYFVAVGSNRDRERIMKKKANWYIAIHPRAVISSDAEIGEGVAVMANAVVNPASKICRGVIINTAATVDHDDVIKEFAHISPGAHLAGRVTVGARSWIGMGANVVNNTEICEDVIIGAGSLVTGSINEKGTYVGVPVRKIN